MQFNIDDVFKLIKKAVEDLKLGVEVKITDGSVEDDAVETDEERTIKIDDTFEIAQEQDGKFSLIEWQECGGSYMEPPDLEDKTIVISDAATVIYEVCHLIVTRPVEHYFEFYDEYIEQEFAIADARSLPDEHNVRLKT